MQSLISSLMRLMGLRTTVATITSSLGKMCHELRLHAEAEQAKADLLADEYRKLVDEQAEAIRERKTALTTARNIEALIAKA